MGLPWKKILQGAAMVGKTFGGLVAPGLPQAIEAIEEALPAASGPDKKAAVETISDAFLKAGELLDGLTPAQVAQMQAARSKAIDAYVAARNAEAAAKLAIDEFEAVVASFKKAA